MDFLIRQPRSRACGGLSAGIDFETWLFYEVDAGRLLETQRARPGYVRKPVMEPILESAADAG